MSRTLKLALAMGGGVSLGTFNGAAITEAVKLAVLGGRGRDGKTFERIEIDVLSGASAGALSLCLLLRDLVDDPRNRAVAHEVFPQRTVGREESYAGQNEDLDRILAAQYVQERVWGTDAKLDKLIDFPDDPHGQKGSLFNRRMQEEIARRRILSAGNQHDLDRRRLLADRVLFAMSLTNLSPITTDAREEFQSPGEPNDAVGLNDALRSPSHRDLRVFDLNFDDVSARGTDFTNHDDFPWRWVLMHNAPRLLDPKPDPDTEADLWVEDLRDHTSWQKLAASAIACGAFPLAFEPVVLKRMAYEYGNEKVPAMLPDAFRATNGKPLKFVNYTFVDGGVLNNEPLREAFRLSAFLDSRAADTDFERWVLWVDPEVSAEADNSSVAIHRAWQTSSNHKTIETRNSFEKLGGLIGTYLGIFLDEGRRQEADKIYRTRHTLKLRDTLRALIRSRIARAAGGSDGPAPQPEELAALIKECKEVLETDRKNLDIPPGRLTVWHEVERINRELELGLEPEDSAAIKNSDPGSAPNPGQLALALLLVFTDLTLNAEGKRRDHRLIAIAPVLEGKTATGEKNLTPFFLPGGKFYAFAGFMVRPEACADYEFQVAKYCAHWQLERAGCIDLAQTTRTDLPLPPGKRFLPQPPTRLPDNLMALFSQDLATTFPLLERRIKAVIDKSHLGLLKELAIKAVIWGSPITPELLTDDLKNRMTFTRVTFEFRIKVPADYQSYDSYRLNDGTCARNGDPSNERYGGSDVGIVRDIDGPTILFFADYLPEFAIWRYTHLETNKAFIRPAATDSVEVIFFPRNSETGRAFKIPFPSYEEQGTDLQRHPLAYFQADCTEGHPPLNGWTVKSDDPPALDLTL